MFGNSQSHVLIQKFILLTIKNIKNVSSNSLLIFLYLK